MRGHTQVQRPKRQEEAVPVGGNNTMNTTQHHRGGEKEKLPSRWEVFRSERYKGTPFYHHAASKTSFWKLSDVLKFCESRGAPGRSVVVRSMPRFFLIHIIDSMVHRRQRLLPSVLHVSLRRRSDFWSFGGSEFLAANTRLVCVPP